MNEARLSAIAILEAIARLETYAQHGLKAILGDAMLRDALLWNIFTLSRSLAAYPNRETLPETPGLRELGQTSEQQPLDIDIEQVWRVIQEELPPLEEALREESND